MRKGFLALALALVTATGPVFAQPPLSSPAPAALPAYGGPGVPHLPAADSPNGWALPGGGPVFSDTEPGAGPAAGNADACAPSCDLCGPHCAVCGPPGRVWVRAEYLLWWLKEPSLPPLVTTSPPQSAGILGQPGTTVLFGGSNLDEGTFSGGSFTAGAWLNECQTVGLEGNVFFLGSRSTNFTAGSPGTPGSPVLARPFIDVLPGLNGLPGQENSELVAFPGQLAGTVNVSNSSRLWGASALGICNLCCCDSCGRGYRVDLVAGFNYLELDERLRIREDLTALAGSTSVPAGTTFGVEDDFHTRNDFYGGEIGARAEYRLGRTFLDVCGTVALGDTHEILNVAGSTVITVPGTAPVTLPGGLLALPSNSGRFSRDEFAVVPQTQVDIGYQVTQHLRAYIGYSFLYCSNVIRPGDQIDRVINPSQISSTLGPGTLIGPARPEVLFKETDFWAQGVNFGLELRF